MKWSYVGNSLALQFVLPRIKASEEEGIARAWQ